MGWLSGILEKGYRHNELSPAETVELLIDVSCYGTVGSTSRNFSQQEMLDIISNAESRFPESGSYELEFWLASATLTYTFWFVRGQERKSYLQRAVCHLEKAYRLSEGVIPDKLPSSAHRSPRDLDRNIIALQLGSLLVEEAVIRDLEKAISLLRPYFESTSRYEPAFCAYAEAFYKLKDYNKAAEIAVELHHRASNSAEWKVAVPPAPMRIAASSYRAMAKEHKRRGEAEQAIALFQKLIDTGFATDNDRKILLRMESPSLNKRP